MNVNLDENNFIHFRSARSWTVTSEFEIEDRVATIGKSIRPLLQITHKRLVGCL